MKRIITIFALLFLTACATTKHELKNINTYNFNPKQEEQVINEINNLMKSNYPASNYKKIGFIANTTMAITVENKLNKSGYILEKPSEYNVPLKYFIMPIDDNKIVITLTFGNVKLGKVYALKGNSLIAVSSLNVAKYNKS